MWFLYILHCWYMLVLVKWKNNYVAMYMTNSFYIPYGEQVFHKGCSMIARECCFEVSQEYFSNEKDGVSVISGCTGERKGAVNKRERVLLETDISTEQNHSDHRLVHQTSFSSGTKLTSVSAASSW